jgi:L-threonylcarbamoyladenylate synthase
MKTQLLTQRDIDAAATILREGGLVAIPTETVYGLGADALNPAAVARIFEAKGRPQDNPLILHIPEASWLKRYCRNIPPAAYALAERFWPGPLTMVLPRRSNVPNAVTCGLDTVGIRCPNHPAFLAVLRALDRPVAAPSGNLSGRPSPTCAAHMVEDMDGRIEAIMDGGPCGVGVESTIVDMTTPIPRLLRPGGLPLEALREVLGEVAVDRAVNAPLGAGEKPRAPGMKYRHYAPKAPVTVVAGDSRRTAQYILRHLGERTGVICFDEYVPDFQGCTVEAIGSAKDVGEQARRLFDALRAFDATEVDVIFAQCPGDAGLGLAVANRLKKAAGFQIVDLGEGERP